MLAAVCYGAALALVIFVIGRAVQPKGEPQALVCEVVLVDGAKRLLCE